MRPENDLAKHPTSGTEGPNAYHLRTVWQEIDGSSNPESFIRYLDGAALRLRARRMENLRLLEVGPQDVVLDVGCGVGDPLIDLVDSVVPGVRSVGLDISHKLVDVARQRADKRGVSIEFLVGDAQAIGSPMRSLTVHTAVERCNI